MNTLNLEDLIDNSLQGNTEALEKLHDLSRLPHVAEQLDQSSKWMQLILDDISQKTFISSVGQVKNDDLDEQVKSDDLVKRLEIVIHVGRLKGFQHLKEDIMNFFLSVFLNCQAFDNEYCSLVIEGLEILSCSYDLKIVCMKLLENNIITTLLDIWNQKKNKKCQEIEDPSTYHDNCNDILQIRALHLLVALAANNEVAEFLIKDNMFFKLVGIMNDLDHVLYTTSFDVLLKLVVNAESSLFDNILDEQLTLFLQTSTKTHKLSIVCKLMEIYSTLFHRKQYHDILNNSVMILLVPLKNLLICEQESAIEAAAKLLLLVSSPDSIHLLLENRFLRFLVHISIRFFKNIVLSNVVIQLLVHFAKTIKEIQELEKLENISQICCKFALSKNVKIQMEGIMGIHILCEKNDFLRKQLAHCTHLRGALEIAIACIEDVEFVRLAKDIQERMIPIINSVEKESGSRIELRELKIYTTMTDVLDDIEFSKAKGNQFFSMGNYSAAILHYRHCLSTIHLFEQTQSKQEPNVNLLAEKLSPGTSILIMKGSSLESAMVSCVDENTIDIIYNNNDEEEDQVDLRRVKMIHSTKCLNLKCDCLLNLTKCYRKLNDSVKSMESSSTAISSFLTNWQTWYIRGILNLDSNHLQDAKRDLIQANKLSKKNPNILQAWKRLQKKHKRSILLDKKLKNQMLAYLSNIPELENL